MGADGFIVTGKNNNICGRLEVFIEINHYAVVTDGW